MLNWVCSVEFHRSIYLSYGVVSGIIRKLIESFLKGLNEIPFSRVKEVSSSENACILAGGACPPPPVTIQAWPFLGILFENL